MKRTVSRWTSLLIIVSMLFSLIPALPAFAAGSRILITSISTLQDHPSTITTNAITISATIENVADNEIPNLYYVIYNHSTGKEYVETANKAVKSTTDPYEISFNNVEFTEGLNEFRIRLTGSTIVESVKSGWVVYSPVTNIQDLKIDNEIFLNDPTKLYPSSAPYTGFEVTGTAPNANRIEAYLNGASEPSDGFISGNHEFSFLANVNGGGGDINFKPGDNDLTLVARNGSNSFYAKRSFAYDNGSAFAYNVKVGPGDASAATEPTLRMISAPKITTPNADISAYLKVPVNSVTGAVYYNYADVRLNGQTPSLVTLDLQNIVSTADPAVLITPSGVQGYHVIKFNLFDVPITGIDNSKYRDVEFIFHNGAVSNGVRSTYSFVYEDPNAPYIDHTNWVVGVDYNNPADPADDEDVEITLNVNNTTAINQLPAKLKVYANWQTNAIRAESGSTIFSCIDSLGANDPNCDTYVPGGQLVNDNGTADPADDTYQFKVFTVKLEGLHDGFVELKITPSTTAADADPAVDEFLNGDNPAGSIEYDLTITASPYVIFNNIHEGKTIKSADELICTEADPDLFSCISGKVANFPLPMVDGSNYVEFFINSVHYPSSAITMDNATGNFTLDFNAADIQEGKNSIRVNMYLDGRKVSEQIYYIFKYEFPVPVITSAEPVDSATTPQFIPSQTDAYVTRATSVRFRVEVELDESPTDNLTVQLQVRHPGEDPEPIVNLSEESVAGDVHVFSTNEVDIEQGETVFEFIAENNSGIRVYKVIRIVRENLPYVIQQPVLLKNADGDDQANVNSNYVKIVIQAEGADSVLFGREEAAHDKETDIFTYERKELKRGNNRIRFTIVRGEEETDGEFIVNFIDAPIEGALFKTPMDTKIDAFSDEIQLEFPRGTSFMRNDRESTNQYLTTDRQLLLGIADNIDGKLHPDEDAGSGPGRLEENKFNFRPASKLFWIDAGTIEENADQDPVTYADALTGSGRSPYEGTKFYLRQSEDLVVPTRRGELTIKYDESISQTAWPYLSVYHFDVYEDVNGVEIRDWRNLGGVVDPKRHEITVPIDRFGYYQVMYMDRGFNDITTHPYAREDLETLFAKGYMRSRTNESFGPYDNMTRGEFAQLLVKIYDIPVENRDTYAERPSGGEGTFSDVDPSADYGLYDGAHIEAAARAGILRGIENNRSNHNRPITREEAAIMITRAAELKLSTNLEKTTTALQKSFTDANLIEDYAKPAVEAIVKEGLITGRPNALLEGQTDETFRFDPKETLRRDDAGVIAMRVLRNEKKVPR